MTPSYFIWNGKDSEQMGLWVSQYPDRVRAEERMTQVAVPSRSGRFYLSEGTAIYEPISIYIRVQCRADIDLEPLNDWLSGEGVLVLGYEPNRCYKARVIQEVDFGKISNDLLEGQIRFECDPFKKAYPTEKKITLTAHPDKNVFNKNATDTSNGYVANAYLAHEGAIVPNDPDLDISEYIPVRANTTYTVNPVSTSVFICYYDANHNYIGEGSYPATWGEFVSQTITTPTNTAYVRISVIKEKLDETQLELGSTATAYEPYVLICNGTVENKGTVPAYPVIKITGDGDISLTCNGIPFAITDMDTSVTLDSGARIALDDDGANCLEKTSGTFPVLQRGMNQIGWTGDVTSVEITRNQRWK